MCPDDVDPEDALAIIESFGYTPASLAILIRRAECRQSFAEFFRQSWHVLEPGTPLLWSDHLQAVCDHAQRMVEDHRAKKADPTFQMAAQNLLINLPPRMAKSKILMVALVAWAWTFAPDMKFLCLSGNPSSVTRDARECRQLVESNWYQETFAPGWSFRDDSNAVTDYTTTAGGGRVSRGIRAKITALGGDCVLIDDPNDAKEAHSDAIRRGINNDWDSTIYNRVTDMRWAIRIAIQQRVHEDDFSAHVLKKGNWAHLCLPLEYEVQRSCECASCSAPANEFGFTDPRTVEGESLHPERFPPEVLADLKVSLGSYSYAGQCQQHPDPADGGMFRWQWWRFWVPDGVRPDGNTERPHKCYQGDARARPAKFDQVVLTIDCAFKDLSTSDRVAAFVVGRVGADRFILDRRCDRYDFGATKRIIRELCALWPAITAKYVEDKANGTAVINDLQAEIPGLIAVNPEGGKASRASIMTPSVEAGNWYLPDGVDWLDDFCHEFAVFPNGRHDDQVDSLSQAAVKFQFSPAAVRAAMGGLW